MELGVHIFFHYFKRKTEEYTLMSDIQTMGQTSYFFALLCPHSASGLSATWSRDWVFINTV